MQASSRAIEIATLVSKDGRILNLPTSLKFRWKEFMKEHNE